MQAIYIVGVEKGSDVTREAVEKARVAALQPENAILGRSLFGEDGNDHQVVMHLVRKGHNTVITSQEGIIANPLLSYAMPVACQNADNVSDMMETSARSTLKADGYSMKLRKRGSGYRNVKPVDKGSRKIAFYQITDIDLDEFSNTEIAKALTKANKKAMEEGEKMVWGGFKAGITLHKMYDSEHREVCVHLLEAFESPKQIYREVESTPLNIAAMHLHPTSGARIEHLIHYVLGGRGNKITITPPKTEMAEPASLQARANQSISAGVM